VTTVSSTQAIFLQRIAASSGPTRDSSM